MKKYNIRYSLEMGAFDRAEVKDTQGATDEVIIVSILVDAEGNRSYAFITGDGKGEPLSNGAVFTAWSVLAKVLSQTMGDGTWQREVSRATFHAISQLVRAGREDNHGEVS